MRRLWVALALLAAVTGLCVVTQCHQQHQVDLLLTQLDALEETFMAGEMEAARLQVTVFCDEYHHRTRLFTCFLSHDDLEGLRECMAVLPATLAGESTEEFVLEAARCRALLQRLRRTDNPIWRNIL